MQDEHSIVGDGVVVGLTLTISIAVNINHQHMPPTDFIVSSAPLPYVCVSVAHSLRSILC
jgi:hypothetical protein